MSLNKTTIEVRYQETDQMGIVYHANYLVWFEIGRTKFVEDLGFKYAALEKDNVLSPVVDIHIQYKKPAKYGDKVYVYTWISQYNGVRTTYCYEIRNHKNDILVTGESEHVLVDAVSFRPLRLQKVNQQWHEAYKKALRGGI
ncbi:MAG TPA: thioesterase family protein [Pseudogracilibacillus sp.]|nr:thioesterase family protein [Pseudogracilibacillus sp.]